MPTTRVRPNSGSKSPPLYHQLAERIMVDIVPSVPGGGRLPSERQLCERYAVSRVTMRAALHLLAADGTLQPAAARGWFVPSGSSPDGPAAGGPIFGFTQTARSQGQSTSAQVLRSAVRAATLDEAEVFKIVAGSAVFELRRLRFLEGLVIAIDSSLVPLAICPDIATHDFSTESLYQVLRAATPPVVPTVADYAVQAVSADHDESALLELPHGMPLLVARQITRDQTDRTFEIGSTHYRGDRFRFRASIGVTAN